jgi:hypothetical protein
MNEHLTSVDDVIDALGGNGAVASMLGLIGSNRVSNWRARGSLPADKFLLMQAELQRRGLRAPPSLWGIASPNEAA